MQASPVFQLHAHQLQPHAASGLSSSSGSGLVGSGLGSPSHPTAPSASSEMDEKTKLRFQVELEFVQCLGNPNYLNFLAQRGYFKDPAFVNYLAYLRYWSKPEYVVFLKYPVCLHFLELLQHESFRKEIANGACAKFLDDQTILQWQSYTRKRIKLVEGAAAAGPASHDHQASGASGSSGNEPVPGREQGALEERMAQQQQQPKGVSSSAKL